VTKEILHAALEVTDRFLSYLTKIFPIAVAARCLMKGDDYQAQSVAESCTSFHAIVFNSFGDW
jgi:hypothetical protein